MWTMSIRSMWKMLTAPGITLLWYCGQNFKTSPQYKTVNSVCNDFDLGFRSFTHLSEEDLTERKKKAAVCILEEVAQKASC